MYRIVSSLLDALREVSRHKIVLKLLGGRCLWAEMHDRRIASGPARPGRELADEQHQLPGAAAEACSSGTGFLPLRFCTSSRPIELSTGKYLGCPSHNAGLPSPN